ncbi:LuxR family transcriptional regulator [Paractinoplanes ferrugineus]|uniref:LuxR family transcriptional regulator n=1 Tax=Paractinoplanes ferrugineus TaxID=113564 RepID=A0A919JA72_9ACTN|nr:LuxR family transcriptional regulator [Actinoplanes ferrugineus]GIE15504.1 LuxR family transcriptional regulator [Actinoplanes ferrugineus]
MGKLNQSAELIGRRAERQRIDDLVAAARAGHGGALVILGEAGIGKSALLAHAGRAAAADRIITATGSEFEAELPYAALHQLCLPLLDGLPELPEPQRAAMEVALGLVEGRPDPLRIGLATLNLLVIGGRGQPLVCLIDDAQWLDDASTRALVFVARRIGVERVAVVFAVRSPAPVGGLDELPSLTVLGLSDVDARAFLSASSHVALDPQVRDRIVAEARGNPLALLELPKAGGFIATATLPVQSRIERGYQHRLTGLADEPLMLLTIASADPTGNASLLWSAARRLGLDVAAAAGAVSATGLVDFATRIRFCHPLARSAVYRAAPADRLRTAHRALADVTDSVNDPDRRAWHRAQSCVGPDDDVAAELERCAATATSRGGVPAAAAFLEKAAALTLDRGRRIERTLIAAQANLDAGHLEVAADLIAVVNGLALDVSQQARADRISGGIAFVRHDARLASTFMLRAARSLAAVDSGQARDYLIDTAELSLTVGCASSVLPAVLAEAAQVAPTGREPDVLDALSAQAERGHRVAAPLMRRVLDGAGEPLWVRRPSLAIMISAELWDADAYALIATSLLAAGRRSGAPLRLRVGLAQAAQHAILTGDIDAAITATAEEEAVADATGQPPLAYHRLQLAAIRGRQADAVEVRRASAAAPVAGQLRANVSWAAAVMYNGLADYPAALRAARCATSSDDLFLTGMALPELIESAVRCGEADEASDALQRLAERAEGSRTPTGLGVHAYARALVTGQETDFAEAVQQLRQSIMLTYRARAHLLYGEWLRREGRRRDARRELRTAHNLFSERGIEGFARRASHELRATGENARRRTEHKYDHLTMQELYIARHVATGATSQEVATQLFLSPRTVDAHLRNIYRKLGISSRRQLRDLRIVQAQDENPGHG